VEPQGSGSDSAGAADLKDSKASTKSAVAGENKAATDSGADAKADPGAVAQRPASDPPASNANANNGQSAESTATTATVAAMPPSPPLTKAEQEARDKTRALVLLLLNCSTVNLGRYDARVRSMLSRLSRALHLPLQDFLNTEAK